eukprot:2063228-Rhodomonas_salina.1
MPHLPSGCVGGQDLRAHWRFACCERRCRCRCICPIMRYIRIRHRTVRRFPSACICNAAQGLCGTRSVICIGTLRGLSTTATSERSERRTFQRQIPVDLGRVLDGA